MDIVKLQGIVEAIEAESKLPSPSHSNLARLVAMFCRELLKATEVSVSYIAPPSNEIPPMTVSTGHAKAQVTMQEDSQEEESKKSAKAKKGRSK